MRGGSTMRCGHSSPWGSNMRLISAKAASIFGPNCQRIHSPRHRPSPCSPLYAPLYLRTSADASSAIARMRGAPSRRMSRIGRTCSVPTEACAYQVPRVPCLRNTCVSASVYSARCSSGTAQSSMKLTGLPSPRRLIMMLRPALRTSHKAFCGASSGISTTEPGRPRSPISSTSCASLRSSAACSAPANSTSSTASGSPISAERTVGAKAGLRSASSIIVRSTSSTAVSVPSEPSPTMCCAESIAL